MNVEEVLQSLYHGKVQFIERVISVDYDNQRQVPLSFVHEKRRHQIAKVINKYKGNLSPEDLTFIVRTDNGELYVLDLHICSQPSQGQFYKSFWILSRRLLRNVVAANPVSVVEQ
jgi:ribosome biogenesis protein Tsr3